MVASILADAGAEIGAANKLCDWVGGLDLKITELGLKMFAGELMVTASAPASGTTAKRPIQHQHAFMDVVGESFHQDALGARAIGGRAPGFKRLSFTGRSTKGLIRKHLFSTHRGDQRTRNRRADGPVQGRRPNALDSLRRLAPYAIDDA
jgi:hypothetical protein